MTTHIFIDHSNMWGGARAASKIMTSEKPDSSARLSVPNLIRTIEQGQINIATRIVTGGIPPGMEAVWLEYQAGNYDTQKLFRDPNWKERGVDHNLIGHIWRVIGLYAGQKTTLILASGDGKENEFRTSYLEALNHILNSEAHKDWNVIVASFDWTRETGTVRSPTSSAFRSLINKHPSRAKLLNLFAHYRSLVYHQ